MMICMIVLTLFANVNECSPAIVPDDTPVTLSPEAPEYTRHWYFSIGAINFYPGLNESEKEIDEKINNILGVLPCWEEPTTFSDWRDNHTVWDLNIGIGRDCSPKLTLMLWVGGARGVIKNDSQYGYVDIDIRFERTAIFLAPEISWYPWGKINYEKVDGKKGSDWVRAALAETKPFLSTVAGYTWVRGEGKAKFSTPLLGTFYSQEEKKNHHLLLFSPRLGVETPIGKRSSISLNVFYNFYNNHSREYDSPCISLNYRLRF